MEVPPALRDVTNQSSLNEMASLNNANGCGTPADLCERSAKDEQLLQIAQQCEFYFSDANILKDQFLLKKVKASEDGWVQLAVIEGFKKVQKLSTDHNMIVQALRSSKKLEVSDDGLNVRRRDPLPQWDPSVYYRTLVISELPDEKDIHWEKLTQFFTAQGFPPVLARSFVPGRKIPSDLKRSQALHPLLATEPSAVVEFADREQASKALSAIRKQHPDAYIHFLSDGAKKKSDENPKKKKKEKKPPAALKQPCSGRPAFLLNLRQPIKTSQVIHIREPIGPPSENSLGFANGWRELIRLERMCCTAADVSVVPDPSVCPAQPAVSLLPHLSVGSGSHPLVPNDSAIVSVIPAFPTSSPTE